MSDALPMTHTRASNIGKGGGDPFQWSFGSWYVVQPTGAMTWGVDNGTNMNWLPQVGHDMDVGTHMGMVGTPKGQHGAT